MNRHLTGVMVVALAAAWVLPALATDALAAETPKRGGILTFVVGAAGPPHFDGHQRNTFAIAHPIGPFYSVLVRVNPDNPASMTDIVCDLCTEIPKPTDGGKRYAFKIRKNVRFHDGSPLTAHDVVATYNKIIFPPKGMRSLVRALFSMVRKVYAPDDYTVAFDLKYPSGAFISALADPFNFIYSKLILEKDIHWYETNIMGSGPFKFKRFSKSPLPAFIEGVRNPDYYLKGKPYLDGFKAIFEKQQSKRVEAIRKGTALIEFRGFPPRSRDQLKRALGEKITVQESNWNIFLKFIPNPRVKPFDDPRVRRALTLAIDRWGEAKRLTRIAILKSVGGIVIPGHPLAATKKELEQIAGYWPDLEKSRAEARRLLINAGYPNGLEFTLLVRGIDQPYMLAGAWLVGQWKKVGFKVKQNVLPTKEFYAAQRKLDFQVQLTATVGLNQNPPAFIYQFTSDNPSAPNYGGYQDRVLDGWYDKMLRTADPAKQRRLMRRFEKRLLDGQAHQFVVLWWYRIVPHRSVVRGWKISPSHHMNQDLGNVWLAR